MSNVGQRERLTQDRVVKFFRDELDYDYLDDWQNRKEALSNAIDKQAVVNNLIWVMSFFLVGPLSQFFRGIETFCADSMDRQNKSRQRKAVYVPVLKRADFAGDSL